MVLSAALRLAREGQRHRKDRTGRGAFRAEPAAVLLGDRLGDGQAQPAAAGAVGGRTGAVRPVEPVEDVRQVLRRDGEGPGIWRDN